MIRTLELRRLIRETFAMVKGDTQKDGATPFAI
jgi:hypothetical protein